MRFSTICLAVAAAEARPLNTVEATCPRDQELQLLQLRSAQARNKGQVGASAVHIDGDSDGSAASKLLDIPEEEIQVDDSDKDGPDPVTPSVEVDLVSQELLPEAEADLSNTGGVDGEPQAVVEPTPDAPEPLIEGDGEWPSMVDHAERVLRFINQIRATGQMSEISWRDAVVMHAWVQVEQAHASFRICLKVHVDKDEEFVLVDTVDVDLGLDQPAVRFSRVTPAMAILGMTAVNYLSSHESGAFSGDSLEHDTVQRHQYPCEPKFAALLQKARREHGVHRSLAGASALAPNTFSPPSLLAAMPQSYDYQQQYPQCFLPAGNQGGCGSCYAFAGSYMASERLCLRDLLQSAQSVAQTAENVQKIAQGITDCADSVQFTDAKGYKCEAWAGFECIDMVLTPWGYTPSEAQAIRDNCLKTCQLCSAEAPMVGAAMTPSHGLAARADQQAPPQPMDNTTTGKGDETPSQSMTARGAQQAPVQEMDKTTTGKGDEEPAVGATTTPAPATTPGASTTVQGPSTTGKEARVQAAAAAPAETTAAPAETTAAQAETTAAPAETTAAPAETTAAPAETTAAQAATTAAPVATTAAPAETTSAPAETTAAPGSTTRAAASAEEDTRPPRPRPAGRGAEAQEPEARKNGKQGDAHGDVAMPVLGVTGPKPHVLDHATEGKMPPKTHTEHGEGEIYVKGHPASNASLLQTTQTSSALLSAQSLVSCGSSDRTEYRTPHCLLGPDGAPDMKYTQGCNGATLLNTILFMHRFGLPTEQCAPYVSGGMGSSLEHFDLLAGKVPKCMDLENQQCHRFRSTTKIGWPVRCAEADVGCIMNAILTGGPVMASLKVTEGFMSNIYPGSPALNNEVYSPGANEVFIGHHVVTLHGWGQAGGVPYWIGRNSWGTSWGFNGMFKIRRGTNELDIEGAVYYADPTFTINPPQQTSECLQISLMQGNCIVKNVCKDQVRTAKISYIGDSSTCGSWSTSVSHFLPGEDYVIKSAYQCRILEDVFKEKFDAFLYYTDYTAQFKGTYSCVLKNTFQGSGTRYRCCGKSCASGPVGQPVAFSDKFCEAGCRAEGYEVYEQTL